VERIDPEVVVVTGDLAHRGKRRQHEQAAGFLRNLGRPLLVVPGNHDIPRAIPARFTRTFEEFEREWQTTEPLYRSDALFAVGINSVRPWRHQSGGVRAAQLERTTGLLAEAPAGALKVVLLHHQLIGAPWRSRKRPVSRRHHVLAALVDAGAELILAGHIHQAAISERHEFEVVQGDVRGVTVSTAPGLGQPRPRRRGEARGVLAYEADDETVRIETHVWRDEGWILTAVRRFPRGLRGL
jgi:3',5'-cyclic AMP phosphodiesterase CpdA